MALFTPNRNYRIPDENAVPPESGTDAFMHLKGAVTAIDFDIAAIIEILTQKAALNHTHAISEVEGLAGQLDSKMAASRTFTLDDLVDVDGASQSPVGYILVKTATGWLPQSAAAAIGNHEHPIQQIVGLAEALTGKQSVSEKGVANGYPSLGADTKIPLAQLPATTTTATVGAALAGASGKAVPSDGDRFSGILSGVSTVFWTTWGNIKSALKAYFDTVYAGRNLGEDFYMHANFNAGGLYFYNGAKTTAYGLWSDYNKTASASAVGNAFAIRDGAADIHARLFRSTWADEGSMYSSFMMRADDSGNNYMRPVTWPTVATHLANNGAIASKIETRASDYANYAISQIMATIAAQGVGALGTYAFCCVIPNVAIAPGQGVSGSDLYYTSAQVANIKTSLTGSYRSMGRTNASTSDEERSTLFLKYG